MGNFSNGCITFPNSYGNKKARKLFDRLSKCLKRFSHNVIIVIEGF